MAKKKTKKEQVPNMWYAVCRKQAAKAGIQKDSITGSTKRATYVEKCIKSMKAKKGIRSTK